MRRSAGSRSSASCQRPGATFLGQAEATQLLQPARPERLSEGVAIRSRPDASGLVGFTQEAAVDTGEAVLLDLGPQPRLDLQIGSRPEVQADDLCRALAHALAQILARDDQVLAPLVPPRSTTWVWGWPVL